jgi:anti-sigma regulatory factor (Ser/Thr protein kinase)
LAHFFFPYLRLSSSTILQARVGGFFLLMRQRDTTGVSLASGDGFLLKLELYSDPQMLCVVRGALERLTEVFGFSPPDRRSVTRAVDEALTNIMRHCYNGQTDQPIKLYCSRVRPRGSEQTTDGLEIILSDHGPAIDPAKLRGRRLDEIKPGGLGLHFIRQSMDTVEYRRSGDTNEFRLVKYLQPSTQSRTP